MSTELKIGDRVRSLIPLGSAYWAPEQPDLPVGSRGTVIGRYRWPGGEVDTYTVLLDESVDPLPVGMYPQEVELDVSESTEELEAVLTGLMERFRDDTRIDSQLFGSDLLAAAEVLNMRLELRFAGEQAAEQMRQVVEAWKTALVPALEAAGKQLKAAVEQLQQSAARVNQLPAWRSPYGPKHRRR